MRSSARGMAMGALAITVVGYAFRGKIWLT